MPDEPQRPPGILTALADDAERFVRVRIERLGRIVRALAEDLAEAIGERFSRHLVEEIGKRLAARLAWGASAIGALVIAVWLLVMGMAGALGEALGREWLGQLAAGALTIVVVLVSGAIAASVRRRRTRADEQLRTREAQEARQASQEQERAAVPEAALPRASDGPSGGLRDQAVQAGTAALRRHPVAGAAALSAAGLLVGTLLGRTTSSDESSS